MDLWEPSPQRHKRAFEDMSHPATLSPSPIHFGNPSTSNFFASSRFNAASENVPPFFERRRTSHPHNYHSQRASEEMSERSQSQLRPRLQSHASRNVIDLTDDAEDGPAAPRNRAGASSSRPQRPPHLGRSDAISLRDREDLIDLTEDGDNELQITGARQLSAPQRPRSGLRMPIGAIARPESPSLFVDDAPPVPPPNRLQLAAAAADQGRIQRARFAGVQVGVRISGGMAHHDFPAMQMLGGLHIMHQVVQNGGYQAMPGVMNYGQAAWQNRRPEHIPPPPAQDDFTRSPTEADTIICPSCESELVHDTTEEPPTKKGGKATKKDRAEHPFWVVKDCGHVYCNSCYQLRSDGKKHDQIAFQETTAGKRKGLKCAVDDCESEVKAKDKWVGVFL